MPVARVTVHFITAFLDICIFLNNDLLKTFSCDKILENKL